MEFSKEWCLYRANLESDLEIGAGLTAFDPIFDFEKVQNTGEPSIAFSRFVSLMRRKKGLTLEKLAQDADIEVTELIEIEEDNHHKPELRTVYQLANYFDVPRQNLIQLAGLMAPRNKTLIDEAVRFAARSEPIAQLSTEECAALEAFISVISEQEQ